MRGVIGGDTVYRAAQVLPESVYVHLACQPRAHIRIGAQPKGICFSQEEVMRGHFAGNRQPLSLGFGDQFDFVLA